MTDLLQSTTTETSFVWNSLVPEKQETDWGSASLWAGQNDGERLTSISSWSSSSSDLPEYGTSARVSQPESESDALPSSTSTRPLRSRQSETGVGCWQATLADLLDQALTVDAFIGAARQAFGEACTVVPIGEGIAMQQVMPPQRIIITEMVSDMVTGAACY
jgi:hypothetical protein